MDPTLGSGPHSPFRRLWDLVPSPLYGSLWDLLFFCDHHIMDSMVGLTLTFSDALFALYLMGVIRLPLLYSHWKSPNAIFCYSFGFPESHLDLCPAGLMDARLDPIIFFDGT